MYRSGRWRRSGSLGKVLIDFGDFELTLREAIFGVAIAGVLYMLGFFCAGLIEKSVHDEQLKYRQAAQIQVQSEFAHAMKTDVGLAFVHGHFRTLDPVQYDNLPGKHLMIRACYQKYQMHTRIVHYTTGTGKNLRHHTRTEHYWTWDTYKTDTKHAKQVEFCGSKFDQSAFAYGGIYGRGHTANIGYHHRIVFTTLPETFDAAFAGMLAGGSVQGQPLLRENQTIAKLYEEYTTSHAVMWFWIGYGIVGSLALFGFIVLENNWLEDKEKETYG